MQNINFDSVLEDIGPAGRYQIFHFVLLGLSLLTTGCNHLGSVFIAGLPVYHCNQGDKVELLGNYSVVGNGSLDVDIATAVDECVVVDGNTTEQCTAWSYETDVFKSTIASEWDLVCSEEWKLALSQSIYMFGVLLGAIASGNFSDMFGRKLGLMVSLVVTIISSCVAPFMPNYVLFVLVRFVVGFFTCGIITCGFVLMMEIIGTEHRMLLGMIYQGWFAAGYMLLSLIAYFIRDYKYIQLTIGLYTILFLSYWWLLGESPRWLLQEGRYDEALKEIKRIARMNKKVVPQALLNKEMETLTNNNKAKTKQNVPTSQKYTVVDLLKTPNMRRKTLNTWFQWLVVSMIYYGLSMGVGSLAGGPYLNLVLSALIEYPGYLIAIMVLNRVGRRLPLSAFNLVGGVACIAMACIPTKYNIAILCFSLVGKMAISAAFALVYVYSAELFPTVTRTVAVGSGSMCARIGSLLSPFIALTGSYWRPLPYLIFGGFSITAGLLALILPETLHQPLPETIEDGEEFGKNAHKQIFKLRHTN